MLINLNISNICIQYVIALYILYIHLYKKLCHYLIEEIIDQPSANIHIYIYIYVSFLFIIQSLSLKKSDLQLD